MASLDEMFAEIRAKRDRLDDLDTQLSSVILLVENTLADLRPGIPVHVDYGVEDDTAPRRLSFCKRDGMWRLTWLRQGSKEVDISAAPRHVRAELFEPLPGGSTPLASLIRAVPAALDDAILDRTHALAQANSLIEALAQAGFEPK